MITLRPYQEAAKAAVYKHLRTRNDNPCVVLPNGFNEEGTPVSISFIGRLYREGTLLVVARAYQDATDFEKRRPPMFR